MSLKLGLSGEFSGFVRVCVLGGGGEVPSSKPHIRSDVTPTPITRSGRPARILHCKDSSFPFLYSVYQKRVTGPAHAQGEDNAHQSMWPRVKTATLINTYLGGGTSRLRKPRVLSTNLSTRPWILPGALVDWGVLLRIFHSFCPPTIIIWNCSVRKIWPFSAIYLFISAPIFFRLERMLAFIVLLNLL